MSGSNVSKKRCRFTTAETIFLIYVAIGAVIAFVLIGWLA